MNARRKGRVLQGSSKSVYGVEVSEDGNRVVGGRQADRQR